MGMTPKLLLLATVWVVRSFTRHVLGIEGKFGEWRKGEREVQTCEGTDVYWCYIGDFA